MLNVTIRYESNQACPSPPSSYRIVYTHLLVSTQLPCCVLCRLLVVRHQAPPRLVSSRLVSSRLVSSRLVSSRLVSSRLVSSLIGLVVGPYPLLSLSSTRSDDERRRVESPTPPTSSSSLLLLVEHLLLVDCCGVKIIVVVVEFPLFGVDCRICHLPPE
jgi:hypothetical protein